MKYKKQIATGALALSLLISGSFVFAENPRDLGIKNIELNYNKQSKDDKNIKKDKVIGTISSINENGFIVEIKNIKTQKIYSLDVKTDDSTIYSKNGIKTIVSDLATGQKVIINGIIDKTTNIITAQKVKITTPNLNK